MKKIYIAGKISQECETPELLKKCQDKFNNYGLKQLYPPDGKIKPYTISGFGYSSNEEISVNHSDIGICFTHGLIINHNIIPKGNWDQYMKNDIKVMLACDEVHFLPDWKDSNGAKIEHQLCLDLGIKIVYVLA